PQNHQPAHSSPPPLTTDPYNIHSLFSAAVGSPYARQTHTSPPVERSRAALKTPRSIFYCQTKNQSLPRTPTHPKSSRPPAWSRHKTPPPSPTHTSPTPSPPCHSSTRPQYFSPRPRSPAPKRPSASRSSRLRSPINLNLKS